MPPSIPLLEALRASALHDLDGRQTAVWEESRSRLTQSSVELLATKGVRLVTRIERKIPSKRMATRNAIASTMRGETILVVPEGVANVPQRQA